MNYKKTLIALIAVATIAYPFIVYFSLNTFGPSLLALVLFIILLVRLVVRGDYQRPEQYVQLILVGGLCIAAAWLNSEKLLRYYPVMMNLAFAGFFFISLFSEMTLIERFARMFLDDIPSHGESYLRNLTMVWGAVLVVNAAIAFYTACCLSLKAWTFYNGFLAYVVLGLVMLIEYVYRQLVVKPRDERL